MKKCATVEPRKPSRSKEKKYFRFLSRWVPGHQLLRGTIASVLGGAGLLGLALAEAAPLTIAPATSSLVKNALRYDLVDVPTLIPNVTVELPYQTEKNITKKRLYPAEMPCLLKKSTAVKLQKAADYLKRRGARLKIWDAWRPLEVQYALYVTSGPNGYVSDPRLMGSQHNGGTAVDVTLTDLKGNELRMPTKFDDFTKNASCRYKGPEKDIEQNLNLLQDAMTSAGFGLLDIEWWHFYDKDFDGVKKRFTVQAKDIDLKLPPYPILCEELCRKSDAAKQKK